MIEPGALSQPCLVRRKINVCSISTVNISKCSFESVGIMNGDYNLNCDERRQQRRRGWTWACVIMLRRDLRDPGPDDICIARSGQSPVPTQSLIVTETRVYSLYLSGAIMECLVIRIQVRSLMSGEQPLSGPRPDQRHCGQRNYSKVYGNL